MKCIFTFYLFLLFSINLPSLSAQQENIILNSDEAFNRNGNNNARNPCISPNEYLELERQCKENIDHLGLSNPLNRISQATLLNWPLRAANGFNDCDFYFIGAYVDQNTTTGAIQDYDCGTNTYDGHHGTDIAAWPFGFYKMDNNLVEVVAAAAGTIVQKADGNFDRNCTSNSLTANSIIIQHADGSQALYWHMKNGSITSKSIGQTVLEGEYLGVVGSSGSSSGPHLHFEVWTGNTNTTYNDPFSGSCNLLNASTWWNAQRPHTNSAVVKVSTNTTDIVLPGCPTTETPNESDVFAIPFQGPGLPAGYAKFYIFIRDDVTGMTANCSILNPNESTFSTWTYTSTSDNKTYVRGYSKQLPTISGIYMFQVIYNGDTCSKIFTITQVSDIPKVENKNQFDVIQNQATGELIVSVENLNKENLKFCLLSITGQILKEFKKVIVNNSINEIISISEYPSGFYFLIIDSGKERFVKKIFVQN
jgi:murein DD-endopeptidase MepM/ murein hydrolase activator NlpD